MRKRVLSMFIALSTICVASNSALSISALSAEEATDNMVVEETNNVGTIEENVDFSFATKDVDSTDTEKLKDGQYTYVLNDGKAIITEVDDNISGSIVIPSTLGGHPVKEIRPMVFRNCYGLTNVVIPEGITDIGRNAFSGCSNLVSVVIPKDVNQIHMGAFEGCTSLKDITLPKNLTSIGNRAFMNCTSVETIEIPESVQFIDVYAFRDCISLADIILSDNIESIGAGAFTNTKYYNNEQNWENGTLYIGNHLIATNPDYIGEQYAIKAGTKTINEMAFASCNSLRSLIIPISLTHMYYDTFSYFDRLSDVYYEGNEIQWKEIAYNGDDLTLIPPVQIHREL